MSGRSRGELEQIRTANRRQMGMAGLGADVFSTATSVAERSIGPVRVGSAFPAVDYTYDPSAPSAPASGGGSGAALWLTQHVVRPFVTIQTPFGPISYDPGAGKADYSGYATAAVVVAGAGLAVGIAYVIARAFGKRRSNPCRCVRRLVAA